MAFSASHPLHSLWRVNKSKIWWVTSDKISVSRLVIPVLKNEIDKIYVTYATPAIIINPLIYNLYILFIIKQ